MTDQQQQQQQQQQQKSQQQQIQKPTTAKTAQPAQQQQQPPKERPCPVRLCGTSCSPCGYCSGKRAPLVSRSPDESSKSYGILIPELADASQYHALLYRGWRRSGQHLYRPDNWDSCCPALTIRLPVHDFVPTKSQRRVEKKMQRALGVAKGAAAHVVVVDQTATAAAAATTTTTASSIRRPSDVSMKAVSRRSSDASMKDMSATSLPGSNKNSHKKQRTKSVVVSPEVESVLSQLSVATQKVLQEMITDEPSLLARVKTMRYKLMPPTTTNLKSTKESNDETKTTAVSTICAAIAGPSKGKYQRGSLAQQVVELLQQRQTQTPNNSLEWKAHEKSGQIRCTFVIHKSSKNSNKSTENATKQRQARLMNGGNNGFSSISDGTIDMEAELLISRDPIAEWFQKYHPTQGSSPHALSITTVPALESSLQADVHQLYFDYQQKVHNDASPLAEEEDADIDDWGDATPDYIRKAQSMLRMTYPDYSSTNLSKMMSAFSSFYRFLVETPLLPNTTANATASNEEENNKTETLMTGTFHQHYRIHGTLIAVGVVDILPGGLSSVYAFYDAAFAHTICPLGKFMILKEIEYCRTSSGHQQLPHYYLGYYIHSCGKMRYKADYHPSQLLCPKTLKWVDATEAQATLDKESPERHCCQLYNGTSEDDDDEAIASAVMESIPLHVGMANWVTLDMLHPNGQEIVKPLVREFVEQVGLDVSRKCVLKLV